MTVHHLNLACEGSALAGAVDGFLSTVIRLGTLDSCHHALALEIVERARKITGTRLFPELEPHPTISPESRVGLDPDAGTRPTTQGEAK